MSELTEIASRAYQDYAGYLGYELTHLHAKNWILWLVALSGLVYALELLLPWRRQQHALRAGFWLDLFYMFFNFFLFALIAQRAGAEVVVHLLRSLLAAVGIENTIALQLGSLAPWLQVLLLFVLRDFLHWNIHRLLHRVPWLWEFHKVHHSVVEMGFAAHLRFHPMETIVYRSFEYLFFALLGFGIDDFFIAHLVALTIGHLNHSNLNPPLGPLRYLLNHPQMHIWHHAKEFPSQHRHGMNFGLSLSLWDWLFRSAYMPRDGRDEALGFPGIEAYPQDFLGQMLRPFRR